MQRAETMAGGSQKAIQSHLRGRWKAILGAWRCPPVVQADSRSHGASGSASTASRPTWARGAIPSLRWRRRARENARSIDQGRDLRNGARIPTFEQAAEKVIRLYEPTWWAGGDDSSAKVWRSSLKPYVVPQARPQAGNRNHDCRCARRDRADLAHQDCDGAPSEGPHLVDHVD